MDRFPLESAADLAGNHARHKASVVWGDVIPEYHPDGPTCTNCDQVSERVTHFPEFDAPGYKHLVCDTCAEECAAILAREKAEAKPVTIETTYNHGQAGLFGEVA